jgi:hypothetical protein
VVYNKMDLVEAARPQTPDGICVSAKTEKE